MPLIGIPDQTCFITLRHICIEKKGHDYGFVIAKQIQIVYRKIQQRW